MQAIQGKEALLADIVKEEMAHWTQVLVLSQLHLQQVKELKSQSDEIRCLPTLLEKQQAILESPGAAEKDARNAHSSKSCILH